MDSNDRKHESRDHESTPEGWHVITLKPKSDALVIAAWRGPFPTRDAAVEASAPLQPEGEGVSVWIGTTPETDGNAEAAQIECLSETSDQLGAIKEVRWPGDTLDGEQHAHISELVDNISIAHQIQDGRRDTLDTLSHEELLARLGVDSNELL